MAKDAAGLRPSRRAAARSPSCPTSRSRRPARRAIRRSPIRSRTSRTACSASSTPTGPIASSGAPTSPACRARYRQCVTFFTEELPWLKGQDLEKVMGRGSPSGSAGITSSTDSSSGARRLIAGAYFFIGRIWPRISPSGYWMVMTLTYQRPASDVGCLLLGERHTIPDGVVVDRDVDGRDLLARSRPGPAGPCR